MNIEILLIIILAILVTILAFLLYARIALDKTRLSSLRSTNIADFGRILRLSTTESDVQSVIDDATNLLLCSFGCDRVLFFKRSENTFQVSISHGFSPSDDKMFLIQNGQKCEEALKKMQAPIHLEEPSLSDMVSLPLSEYLNKEHCRLVMPIWWREKLYGMFFVGNSVSESDRGLALLLAGLSRALGRVEVSEVPENTLSQPLNEQLRNDSILPGVPPRLIELIEHREPHTLVERMIETVKDHLRFDRFAYLYETGNESAPLRVIQDETSASLTTPELDEFKHLTSFIGECNTESPISMQRIVGASPDGDSKGGNSEKDYLWAYNLQRAGFEYLISFPYSSDRAGILAWSGPKQSVDITHSLRSLNETGAVLTRNAESFKRIEELSYTDNLTGVANRRYFFRRLKEEIERAGRYERSLGLLIFDLDELKQINDSYGHLAGDYVIKSMGSILRRSVRAIDVIARYGGDEFCVIMPEADVATVRRSMTRLLRNISAEKFATGVGGKTISSTVSAGGALYPEHAEDSEGLIYAADMALLRAKESGRNCSLLYQSV